MKSSYYLNIGAAVFFCVAADAQEKKNPHLEAHANGILILEYLARTQDGSFTIYLDSGRKAVIKSGKVFYQHPFCMQRGTDAAECPPSLEECDRLSVTFRKGRTVDAIVRDTYCKTAGYSEQKTPIHWFGQPEKVSVYTGKKSPHQGIAQDWKSALQQAYQKASSRIRIMQQRKKQKPHKKTVNYAVR